MKQFLCFHNTFRQSSYKFLWTAIPPKELLSHYGCCQEDRYSTVKRKSIKWIIRVFKSSLRFLHCSNIFGQLSFKILSSLISPGEASGQVKISAIKVGPKILTEATTFVRHPRYGLYCVKSVGIRSYSVWMWENVDQNNSQNRHTLRSVSLSKLHTNFARHSLRL